MIIMAAIIGAGFSSGKEIYSFFGQYGIWSIFMVLLSAILFFYVFYIFSKLGQITKPNSISDMTEKMFGKASVFVDMIFILCSFITLSSMLAGSDSIGVLIFGTNYNFCYISIITALITAVVVSVGLKYIYKITNILLPIIIVFVVTILTIFLIQNPSMSLSNTQNFRVFPSILSAVLYASMNSFTNIFIVAKTGENQKNKSIKIASLISSVALFLLICFILICSLLGGSEIYTSDMPMVSIAFSISSAMGVCYSVLLWLAIFTTLAVLAFTMVEWLNRFIKNKFVCSVIVLTLGFVFSRFGFSTIVDVFYPIDGAFGAIIIVYSIIYYYKNRKQLKSISETLKNSDEKNITEQNQTEANENFADESPVGFDKISNNNDIEKSENKVVKNPKIIENKSMETKKDNINNQSKKQSKKEKSNSKDLNFDDSVYSIKIEKKQEKKVVTKKKKNGDVIKEVTVYKKGAN